MEQVISGLIVQFATNYPILTTVMLALSVLRTINKPLFSILHSIADVTPYDGDDKALAAVESSPIYASICYVLDWFASVKLPERK